MIPPAVGSVALPAILHLHHRRATSVAAPPPSSWAGTPPSLPLWMLGEPSPPRAARARPPAGDMAAVAPVYNYNFNVIAYEAAGSSAGGWRQLLFWLGIPGFAIAALMLASVQDPRVQAQRAAAAAAGAAGGGGGGRAGGGPATALSSARAALGRWGRPGGGSGRGVPAAAGAGGAALAVAGGAAAPVSVVGAGGDAKAGADIWAGLKQLYAIPEFRAVTMAGGRAGWHGAGRGRGRQGPGAGAEGGGAPGDGVGDTQGGAGHRPPLLCCQRTWWRHLIDPPPPPPRRAQAPSTTWAATRSSPGSPRSMSACSSWTAASTHPCWPSCCR